MNNECLPLSFQPETETSRGRGPEFGATCANPTAGVSERSFTWANTVLTQRSWSCQVGPKSGPFFPPSWEIEERPNPVSAWLRSTLYCCSGGLGELCMCVLSAPSARRVRCYFACMRIFHGWMEDLEKQINTSAGDFMRKEKKLVRDSVWEDAHFYESSQHPNLKTVLIVQYSTDNLT